MDLTFSNPRNRSRPSSVNGPAFCNIFSKGVISGAISSFFLTGVSFAGCVAAAWERYFVSDTVAWHAESDDGTRTTQSGEYRDSRL